MVSVLCFDSEDRCGLVCACSYYGFENNAMCESTTCLVGMTPRGKIRNAVRRAWFWLWASLPSPHLAQATRFLLDEERRACLFKKNKIENWACLVMSKAVLAPPRLTMREPRDTRPTRRTGLAHLSQQEKSCQHRNHD